MPEAFPSPRPVTSILPVLHPHSEDPSLRRIRQLIVERTGLRQREDAKLRKILGQRMRQLQITADAYCRLLESETGAGEAEWRKLVAPLTVVESYLFRDKGQFSLLREQILPDLIQRNRERRSLRCWSAGCATGEEPYSLAILLQELLPDYAKWDILILGTDINDTALAKARKGIYSNWSFRGVTPAVRERYFHAQEEHGELDAGVREQVQFRHGNLVGDAYPNPNTELHDMDLILCRNVLIYLEHEAVVGVAGKLAQTLRPEGYLITGHTELLGHSIDTLRTLVMPEGVIYQRCQPGAPEKSRQTPHPVSHPAHQAERAPLSPLPARKHTASPGTTPKQAHPLHSITNAKGKTVPAQPAPAAYSPSPQATRALAAAKTAYREGALEEALRHLDTLLTREPPYGEASSLLARIYADLGQYEQARGICRQVIAQDPLAVGAYRILAQIAEEAGEAEEAKSLLKKAIYLAPQSVTAYLELGSLYQKEGEAEKAASLRAIALDLLRALPADALVAEDEGTTAGALAQYLQEMTHAAPSGKHGE